MAQLFFANHRPAGIPLSYDLGEHILTIQDETISLAEKANTEAVTQELHLDEQEAYRLLITLQALFA